MFTRDDVWNIRSGSRYYQEGSGLFMQSAFHDGYTRLLWDDLLELSESGTKHVVGCLVTFGMLLLITAGAILAHYCNRPARRDAYIVGLSMVYSFTFTLTLRCATPITPGRAAAFAPSPFL